MTTQYTIQNCVLAACTAAVVLGLYAMGAGSDALFGLLLMLGFVVPGRKPDCNRED